MIPFRTIVVGAGGISDAWFAPLVKEGVEVAAVVDLRLEAAQAKIAKHKLSAEASTDLKAMLRKHRPDFVVDLTVPEAHCRTTCTALRAGAHVIGEKPMAATMAQARRMVKAAENAGRLYMISQTRRWDARHEALRRAVAEGAIGRLTTINCDFYMAAHFGGFRDEMPSPLILDMAIHHFDLARLFTGAGASAVYAKEFNPSGSWYKGDAAASVIFEMATPALAAESKIIFTYRGSWCSEGCHTSWNGNWRLVGEKGTLLYENDQDARGQVVARAEGVVRPMKDISVPPADLQYPTWHGALREMLEFLRTGKKPQTECHGNIQSLAMVFAALDSSRKGRRVRVGSVPVRASGT